MGGTVSSTRRPPTYRAVAERDSAGWIVRIEGLLGPAGLGARDLADVDARCRKLITDLTGEPPDNIHLAVEVRVPPATQTRLDLVSELYDDIDRERDGVIRDLIEMRIPLLDISRVLAIHHREPRPVTVTNREIADHGLAKHPDPIGVEWDDHGHFKTRKCRRHVEATRGDYGSLDPDEPSALVYADSWYAAAEWRCDLCDEAGETDD